MADKVREYIDSEKILFRDDLPVSIGDLKTELQWIKEKKIPKNNAEPIMLFASMKTRNRGKLEYYSGNDVRPMTLMELEKEKAKRKEKNKTHRTNALLKKQLELNSLYTAMEQNIDNLGYQFKRECFKLVINEPDVICDSIFKYIIFDYKALNFDIEYLKLIDEDGNILFDRKFKPYAYKEYSFDNGVVVKSDTLSDYEYIHCQLPYIRGIIKSAKMIKCKSPKAVEQILNEWGLKEYSVQLL